MSCVFNLIYLYQFIVNVLKIVDQIIFIFVLLYYMIWPYTLFFKFSENNSPTIQSFQNNLPAKKLKI